MTVVYMFSSLISLGAAMINFGEIRRDPDIPGWVFGLGFLFFLVFGFLAIWRA